MLKPCVQQGKREKQREEPGCRQPTPEQTLEGCQGTVPGLLALLLAQGGGSKITKADFVQLILLENGKLERPWHYSKK